MKLPLKLILLYLNISINNNVLINILLRHYKQSTCCLLYTSVKGGLNPVMGCRASEEEKEEEESYN